MSDPDEKPNQSPNLEDLSQRLDKAREGKTDPNQGGPRRGDPGSGRGLGFAMRLSTEFVAAVAVGTAIGWFLDKWLGTTPFLLLVFFLFGAAAGFVNVIRAAKEFSATDEGGDK